MNESPDLSKHLPHYEITPCTELMVSAQCILQCFDSSVHVVECIIVTIIVNNINNNSLYLLSRYTYT